MGNTNEGDMTTMVTIARHLTFNSDVIASHFATSSRMQEKVTLDKQQTTCLAATR